MPRTKLFRAGCFLAVLADETDYFWLCCTKTDVYLENDRFSVVWLEKIGGEDRNLYKKMVVKDRVNIESVVSRVTVLREKKNEDGKIVFKLPEKELKRIQKIVEKVKNGSKINAYYDTSAIEMDDEDEPLIGRKRKIDQEESKRCFKNKALTKSKEMKKPKKKKEKVKKPKIDKSDPNWRLKPNINVCVLEKDPLFESDDEVPFVSSIAHSKLAIRAVLLNDMKMLKTVVNDVKQVHNPNVVRSLGNSMTATDYALKMENLTALKSLTEIKSKEKKRVGVPVCSLHTSNTGTYNYRYLYF